VYKSTDGGNHWTGPMGQSAFNARGAKLDRSARIRVKGAIATRCCSR